MHYRQHNCEAYVKCVRLYYSSPHQTHLPYHYNRNERGLFYRLALQITLHIGKILFIAGIFSIFIFIPKCLTVISKRFIECNIAPAFSGYIDRQTIDETIREQSHFPRHCHPLILLHPVVQLSW